MSQDAKANGSVKATPADAEPPTHVVQPSDSFDGAEAMLRLLLGALLVGGDEFLDRLRAWESAAQSAPSSSFPPNAPSSREEAHPSQLFRYALIGLLFDGETRVRRRLSTMVSRLAGLSDETNYVFTTRVAPALRDTPLDPLLRRLDDAAFTALAAIDRWTAQGWLEDQRGRRLARQAASSTVDELLRYLARTPALRQLIEQQSTSIAGDAVDEVRERTASADLWIERLAHNLLHRPASDGPEQPAAQTSSLVLHDRDE